MALEVNHAGRSSWSREFCELKATKNGDLSVEVRALNIVQRILRVIFGVYGNTIWNQKKIDHFVATYPGQTQKIIDLVETLNLYRKTPLKAPTLSAKRDKEAEKIAQKGDAELKQVVEKEKDQERQTEIAQQTLATTIEKTEKAVMTWSATMETEEESKTIQEAPLDPMIEEQRKRTFMIVGPSRIGKTTAVNGLDDYSKICTGDLSLFAATETAHAIAVKVFDQAFNIIDTPGLCENRTIEEEHKRRDDATIINQTKKVVEDNFGGKGFATVGKVIFAVGNRSIRQQDLDTIEAYARELKPEQEKILLFTHSEGMSKDQCQQFVGQFFRDERCAQFKEMFQDNVFFIGALTHERVQYSKKTVRRPLYNVIEQKETLLKALLKGTLDEKKIEEYTKERREAFAANETEFFKSLKPYRKPQKLIELNRALNRLIQEEFKTQSKDLENRETLKARLDKYITSLDSYPDLSPSLKISAKVLQLFLQDNAEASIKKIEKYLQGAGGDQAVEDIDLTLLDKTDKKMLLKLFADFKPIFLLTKLPELEKRVEGLDDSEESAEARKELEPMMLEFKESFDACSMPVLQRIRASTLLSVFFNDEERKLKYAKEVYQCMYSDGSLAYWKRDWKEEEKQLLSVTIKKCFNLAVAKMDEKFKNEFESSMQHFTLK